MMIDEFYRNLLRQGAREYELDLSDAQLDQFSLYAKLLTEWNEKINLTAITDEEGIVIKHFLDSLSIAPLLPKTANAMIDVGTGAGFPGIPLKIVKDDMRVTLLDSLQKRINFLNDALAGLGLKDIKALHGRAEDYGSDKNFREKFDVAAARAVANLPVLLEYCLPFVSVGGLFIAMKGPEGISELKGSEKALKTLGGEVMEVKKFNLTKDENERCVILIKKCRHTPPAYPRKSGKPTRSPIR